MSVRKIFLRGQAGITIARQQLAEEVKEGLEGVAAWIAGLCNSGHLHDATAAQLLQHHGQVHAARPSLLIGLDAANEVQVRPALRFCPH